MTDAKGDVVARLRNNADAVLNADDNAFRLACANALAVAAKEAAAEIERLREQLRRSMPLPQGYKP